MNDFQENSSPSIKTIPYATALSEQYKFIESPGHGWLRVPLREIIQLGIAEKITAYSYMDNQFAYLEEDIDAGVFIRARIGLPDYQECSPADNARAREFCDHSVKIVYQEYPAVRRLRHYQPHRVASESGRP